MLLILGRGRWGLSEQRLTKEARILEVRCLSASLVHSVGKWGGGGAAVMHSPFFGFNTQQRDDVIGVLPDRLFGNYCGVEEDEHEACDFSFQIIEMKA